VSKWIDTSNRKVRTHYAAEALRREDILRSTLVKCGINYTRIATNESYVQPLMTLFGNRV